MKVKSIYLTLRLKIQKNDWGGGGVLEPQVPQLQVLYPYLKKKINYRKGYRLAHMHQIWYKEFSICYKHEYGVQRTSNIPAVGIDNLFTFIGPCPGFFVSYTRKMFRQYLQNGRVPSSTLSSTLSRPEPEIPKDHEIKFKCKIELTMMGRGNYSKQGYPSTF